MTSADLLHRAATLIRERAQAASQGRWCVHGSTQSYGPTGDAHGADVLRHESGFDDRVAHVEPWGGVDDATHIASWHPAVALAVADWLEVEASSHLHVGEDEIARSVYDMPGMHNSPAMRVARAYLGEDA